MSEITFGEVPLQKLRRWALMAAGAWVIICIFCWIFDAPQFYRSYLFAWIFWLGVSLGAMGVVMMHHLIGGEWGIVSRRLGEHAAMCLPLLIVLFIPIAIGVPSLYPWARPDKLRADAILRHEQPYLNYGFFIARAVLYGAIWLGMAWYLRRASLRYDRTSDMATARHAHNLSAIGEVVLFLSMTTAALDWIMSRDAHWISTVFGLMIVCGQAISGLCFMIILLVLLRRQPALRDVLRRDHFNPRTWRISHSETDGPGPWVFNDLGNILLTFVILWAYMAFAQLLVIWMGNKQDEVIWYTARLSNGWWWIGLGVLALHFFVPFTILLMRDAKRQPRLMLGLCAALLVLRLIDVFWTVAPSGADPRPLLHHVLSWMDFVFPVGMGGLWLAFFLWLMEGHPLILEGQTVIDTELRDAES